MPATIDQAKEVLQHKFGFENFRPLQEKIIKNALDGNDALVLMPTGGGKSICYQIPAVIQDGITIVVSPLISLMKDQVEALRGNGIKAAFINSSQNPRQQQMIEGQAQRGILDLLYMAPERLMMRGYQSTLKKMPVNAIAIDEAHCISQWGHDFRPEYTRLKELRHIFPNVPVMALTATADKVTRQDIVKQMELRNPEIYIASFDRPNLSLWVTPSKNRKRQVVEFVEKRKKESGIIYCLARNTTEKVAMALQERGIKAAPYHAGLPPELRSRTQENFITDKVPVVVATIAFGMGIDKSNVRYIVHYNLPKNMEGYYQEIGRAGRDGLPSDTMLIYSRGDMFKLQHFIKESDRSELLMEKLNRMTEYAEAKICRRKILLHYFGEHYGQNCGNCDVCKDPPEEFDGTEIAQKALSAVSRVNESEAMGMIIDILRGSSRREVLEKNYNELKTHGVGKDYSYLEWQDFLQQLMHLGLLEIAYDEGNALKLTPASEKVLYNKEKVKLVEPTLYQDRADVKESNKSKSEQFEELLFDELRALRREIADRQGVPPYVVFSDASLKDMVDQMADTKEVMRRVHGVGDAKLKKYGDRFATAIRNFRIKAYKEGIKKTKGVTYLITLDMYENQGLPPDEIARERGLNEDTVYGHFAKLNEFGHDIPIDDLVDPDLQLRIIEAWEKLGQPRETGPVFEALNEEISFGKIRLVLSKF